MIAQPTEKNFIQLLTFSNSALVITAIAFVVSVLVSYPFADQFTLNQQVAAHISTILIAAFLKVSYVLRCLAQYNLGLEVR
ncbi:hypothetical protein F0231_07550 [Vibrio sp. RE86]|uniref:hypothetical protein n=1 Tax=Vibrio sp. RE86 TaxID=2607605 RepID=UPI0016A25602|nr:hypothetical protein [Vibrio sp. RE86]NOH79597.1 hypothetical protein [Vibrio sp. RE86]